MEICLCAQRLHAAACSLRLFLQSEQGGQSGIAAATLDCVLGDIDGFPFDLVHVGSKLHLVLSGKRSAEPAGLHLAEWPSACPILLRALGTGTN